MSPRSRTPLVIAIVLAVVAVVAIAAVALTGGDGDDGDAASTVPASAGGSGAAAVVVEGTPLPPGEGSSDPAIGTAAPALRGSDYAGAEVAIEPGSDGAMMLVFLAHWCPHCNDEIPVLQEWDAAGDIPDDLQVVGVSTAADAARPNYPPAEWLAEKRWAWPVLADDDELTAADAYGLTGFPFIVFLDADGNVTARVSGEQPIENLQALADATVAA